MRKGPQARGADEARDRRLPSAAEGMGFVRRPAHGRAGQADEGVQRQGPGEWDRGLGRDEVKGQG